MLICWKVRVDIFILFVRLFDVFINVCFIVIFVYGLIYFEFVIGVVFFDVMYYILVGVVMVCKFIYIEDFVFKIKVIENKFLV